MLTSWLSGIAVKRLFFGPEARMLILGVLGMWFFYSLYSDVTRAYYNTGKLEAEAAQSARSDEVRKQAETEAGELVVAVEKSRGSVQARRDQLDAAVVNVVRTMPDMTKDNSKCQVLPQVVDQINGIK